VTVDAWFRPKIWLPCWCSSLVHGFAVPLFFHLSFIFFFSPLSLFPSLLSLLGLRQKSDSRYHVAWARSERMIHPGSSDHPVPVVPGLGSPLSPFLSVPPPYFLSIIDTQDIFYYHSTSFYLHTCIPDCAPNWITFHFHRSSHSCSLLAIMYFTLLYDTTYHPRHPSLRAYVATCICSCAAIWDVNDPRYCTFPPMHLPRWRTFDLLHIS
jgi:hypothetical protein